LGGAAGFVVGLPAHDGGGFFGAEDPHPFGAWPRGLYFFLEVVIPLVHRSPLRAL
jgi:hypothetical protein